jgi:hypothetical protein
MSHPYDQTILDGIIGKLLKSHAEMEAVIADNSLDGVSIEEACHALAKQTEPVDVECRESKPRSKWLDVADSICHDPWRKNVKPR